MGDPTYNNAWNFKDGADSDFEYEYDENGNLTKDLNKNISSIQYNSLNLPTQILFADGNAIRYTYSADGRKLRAVYTTAMPATTKTIDYCGNLIFENGTLKQILVEGGYIMMDDWSHPYCFYIKDHLGNNRMVVNQRGTVDQVNNYYPYGGLMANSTGWNTQRYKYNGKELDRMHGLDWYDYGARWQDAAIGGRWHAMDPLCEKYYNISPYVYCADNPVRFIDPDGMKLMRPKGGENFKTIGLLSIIGGTLMMAGGAVYSVVTEGGGFVVGGGQLISTGYVTIKAGLATYGTGVAIDAAESISKPNPINIKNSKQEAHGNHKAQGQKNRNPDKGYNSTESEHKKNARSSTKEKHEKGLGRKSKDKGNEKGDERRPYRR
ncbi:MAG: RHS repeat-associated core domain-containing protein [Bacteroidaceae bacterium]|nr:RHS repeat-associated core domain-containing protein [Bacteroidaceae bacterium]